MPDSLDALPADHPIHNPAHWWQALTDIRTLLSRINTRDSRKVDLRVHVDEFQSIPSDTFLQLQPTSSDSVLVSSVIVASSNSGGVLRIGDRVIPVPQGVTVLSALDLILRGQVAVTLTATVAGALFVEIMGTELPVTTL